MSNRKKLIIIDYYQNLKHELDIYTERLLEKCGSESKKNEYNSSRSQILQKIDQMVQINLDFIASNRVTGENPQDLFRPIFGFLISSDNNQMCKLVMTKVFLTKNIRNAFEFNGPKRYLKDDEYLINLIMSYLKDNQSVIIDLRNFIIKELTIDFDRACLYNFRKIEYLLNVQEVEHLTLISNRSPIKSTEIFSVFRSLLTLKICSDISEPLIFEMFYQDYDDANETIDNAEIDTTFSTSLLNELTFLKKLEISGRKPCLLDETCKILTNLKYLSIQNCQVYGSIILPENFLALEIKHSNFINDNGWIKNVKNLIYLSLSDLSNFKITVEYLNSLENLEFLSLNILNKENFEFENLNLPKLKYLEINSNLIPNFKHLKLEFLRINDITDFNSECLKNQTELVGLSVNLKENVLKNISNHHFLDIKHLAYIEFEFLFKLFNLNSLQELELYKSFTNRDKILLKMDGTKLLLSIYENRGEFIKQVLHFSEVFKSLLNDIMLF